MKAKYIQKGDSVDFTPSVDMDAGEIVRLGNLIGITKTPVKAGTLGTLAVSGIFDVQKSAGISFTAGSNIFWNSEAGTAAADGIFLGIAVRETQIAQEHVQVLLNYSGNLPGTQSAADGDAEWQPL